MEITAFPRIHVSLIGMFKEGYRMNGGFGFSIKDPKIIVNFRVSRRFVFKEERMVGSNADERNRLIGVLKKIKKKFCFKWAIEFVVSGDSMSHHGFGTTTAIYMSCVEALFIVNDKCYDDDLIRLMSSRGSTSGVGINTYFYGGFVFDVGVPSFLDKKMLPSSMHENRKRMPLVIKISEIPEWPLCVVVPDDIKSKTENEEVDFFKRVCPLSINEVQEIMYEVVFGVMPSLIENDKKVFCEAVDQIQTKKWKKEERLLYGPGLSSFEKKYKDLGIKGIGMSSLGPALFFLMQNNDILLDHKDGLHFFTKMNNEPRKISYD